MRITLKTKIWSTVITIVLLFSSFSLFYFPVQQEKYLLKYYDNEVQNLANTISLGVKIALTEENFEGVQTAMSFVKDDPRLRFVNLYVIDTIWDEQGSYTTTESLLKSFPEQQNKTVWDTSGSVIKKRSGFETEMMSGTIELGLTTDQISEGKKEIRLTSLLVSCAFLVIGIIIGFWLARNISIPVLALRDAANKVGDGDLTQRVYQKSGDEIGQLSTAFNKMVVDLESAREELRSANLNLESTNEALHNTVKDLKAAQNQLVQAEKMASLGQLTAGIAHEINNPINFVTANIQPLKEDLKDILEIIDKYDEVIKQKSLQNEFSEVERFKLDAQIELTLNEVHELLKGIEDGAMRTSEIVKGLRNFSRLDQNVILKANLNDSLDSTLTLLKSSFKNRIEIKKDFDTIPDIECYPGKINQVFMNILSNAIQAISGNGTIYLKTKKEKDQVVVHIKDTGSGMSEEIKNKIFDPFYTTKDVGIGTGLGLSISFGIIKEHNGTIDVNSSPGEGTEFIISLPLTQNNNK